MNAHDSKRPTHGRGVRRGVAVLAAAMIGAAFAPVIAHADTVTCSNFCYDTSNGTGTFGPAMGAPITRDQIIARAKDWVSNQVLYSQTDGWEDSVVGGPYRADCSGYVSMAWALPDSETTYTLPNISHELTSNGSADYSQLLPGDVLLYIGVKSKGSGHVELFAGWKDTAHTTAYVYQEPHSPLTAEYGTDTVADFESGDFLPYRYNNIASAPTTIAVTPTEKESIGGQYTSASQAAAIGQDGDVYHNIRNSSGAWQGWEPMAGFNGASHFSASAVSIETMPDGSSQIAAIGLDGNIYHDIRGSNGVWAGWEPMAGFNGASHFTAGSLSITGMPDGSSQIVATGLDGNIYQDIRYASGVWQGWEPLDGFNGAPDFNASAVATTGMPDGSSQIVATGLDGNIYQDIRYASGTWQGWEPLIGFNGATHFGASGLSTTGMPDGSSQIAAIGLDGDIYHDIRNTDGSWQGWEPVAGENGASHFGAGDVAITALSSGSSEILAAQTGTDELFGNARSSGGVWDGWSPLAGFNGAPVFQVG